MMDQPILQWNFVMPKNRLLLTMLVAVFLTGCQTLEQVDTQEQQAMSNLQQGTTVSQRLGQSVRPAPRAAGETLKVKNLPNNIRNLVIAGNFILRIQEGGKRTQLIFTESPQTPKDIAELITAPTLFLSRKKVDNKGKDGKPLYTAAQLKKPRVLLLRTPRLDNIQISQGVHVDFMEAKQHPLYLSVNKGGSFNFLRAAMVRRLTVLGNAPVSIVAPAGNNKGLALTELLYSGKAPLNINYINSLNLTVNAIGRGDIHLHGVVANLVANLQGKVVLHARAMPAGNAYITTVGHSGAEVWPLAKLQARAFDHSFIEYFHRPKVLTHYEEKSGVVLNAGALAG